MCWFTALETFIIGSVEKFSLHNIFIKTWFLSCVCDTEDWKFIFAITEINGIF